MSGCRIGKVRLKGGAQLLRLPVTERSEVHQELIRAASVLADGFEPDDLAGFVVVGWAFDGHYSTGYTIHADSIVGLGMLPSFVADALRRRMIMEGEWES